MKKILLISSILAISTSSAFAIVLTTSSTQSSGAGAGSGSGSGSGSSALPPIYQALSLNQSIGDTSKGATAINKATVIQAQVPLNFGAP